jgi:hypothetical protein
MDISTPDSASFWLSLGLSGSLSLTSFSSFSLPEDLFPNNEETYKFQKSYKFTNAYLFLNEEVNYRSVPTFFYTLNFLQDKQFRLYSKNYDQHVAEDKRSSEPVTNTNSEVSIAEQKSQLKTTHINIGDLQN